MVQCTMATLLIGLTGSRIGVEGVKVLCGVLGQLTQLTTLNLGCLFNGCNDASGRCFGVTAAGFA